MPDWREIVEFLDRGFDEALTNAIIRELTRRDLSPDWGDEVGDTACPNLPKAKVS